MKFCPQCGKELTDGAKFCDGCGSKIEEVKKEENVEVLAEETKPEEKNDESKEEVLTNTQGLEVVDVDSVVGKEGNYSDEILSVTPELSTTPKTEEVQTQPSTENAPASTEVSSQTAPVNNTVAPSNNMVNNQVPNVNVQKKTNPAIIAVIAVLVVIIIVLVVLIGVKFLGSKTNDNSGNNGNEPDVVEPTTDDDDSTGSSTSNNNNNNSNNNTASSQTTELSGYTFKIPTGYTPNVSDGYLQLTSATDKVQIVAQVLDSYPYSTFSTNTESIKNELISEGYVVTKIAEEKINSTNSLVINGSSNGKLITFVITALNDYDTLLAAYVNYGTKSDSELKVILSNLATTATPKTSSFANKETKEYQAGQVKVPNFTLEK